MYRHVRAWIVACIVYIYILRKIFIESMHMIIIDVILCSPLLFSVLCLMIMIHSDTISIASSRTKTTPPVTAPNIIFELDVCPVSESVSISACMTLCVCNFNNDTAS